MDTRAGLSREALNALEPEFFGGLYGLFAPLVGENPHAPVDEYEPDGPGLARLTRGQRWLTAAFCLERAVGDLGPEEGLRVLSPPLLREAHALAAELFPDRAAGLPALLAHEAAREAFSAAVVQFVRAHPDEFVR